MNENFIHKLIETIGMNPDGAMIGAIGVIVATIGKVNGVSWKQALSLILGGMAISGYAVPAAIENTSFGNGTIFFMVFLLGAISPHVYTALDNFAPTILKLVSEYLKNWLDKKIK